MKTIASEHREMLGRSARQVAEIESFGEIPLIVIASGRPNPAFGDVADEFQRYWIDRSRALAARSDRGRFVPAEQSSHMLHLDAPDLVASSILSVVDGIADR